MGERFLDTPHSWENVAKARNRWILDFTILDELGRSLRTQSGTLPQAAWNITQECLRRMIEYPEEYCISSLPDHRLLFIEEVHAIQEWLREEFGNGSNTGPWILQMKVDEWKEDIIKKLNDFDRQHLRTAIRSRIGELMKGSGVQPLTLFLYRPLHKSQLDSVVASFGGDGSNNMRMLGDEFLWDAINRVLGVNRN